MKEIQYSCGHFGEVYSVSRARIEWLEREGLCPECYKEQQRAKAEKVSEGLPELQGSEKQIAWAKDIRTKFYIACLEYLEARELYKHAPDQVERTANERKSFEEIIEQNVQTKWWIDNRETIGMLTRDLEEKAKYMQPDF